MKAPKSYLEIEIYFKDGTKDWVSPIEDTDEDVYISEDIIIINNGYYDYDYKLKDINRVEVVKIFDDIEMEREFLYKSEEKFI